MSIKHWLVGAAGALALGSLSAPVQAAPLGIGSDARKPADESRALREVVWVRRCWWHNGHRHCRRVWSDSPYYYEPYPYDGYYFYGPSFGFSFGGHGHHHHHGHGHHHRHGGHRHR